MIDVGGVFDSEKDRFDHHQRGFDQTFGRGFDTKLSSAGLVYKVTLLFRVFHVENSILKPESASHRSLMMHEIAVYD